MPAHAPLTRARGEGHVHRGRHNVVRLVGGMRNNDSVVLVLDHFENHDIKVCVCARAPTRGGTTET